MAAMLSPRRQTALISLTLFVGLGALAIHASPLSAGALEARLQERADDALRAIRADDWASVELNGQTAILTGLAPNRREQDAALEALAGADWAGGVVAGGVTEVIDQTRLARESAAVQFNADLAGGRVVIRGLAPDAAMIDAIEAEARRLFTAGADVELTLAPGSAPEGFEVAVRLLLSELSRLDVGGGRITRDRMVLTGLAANSAAATQARLSIERGAGGFDGAALVRTDGGRFTTTIEDALHCRLLIEAALGADPIAFAPGGDRLTETSAASLRRAGAVFAACSASPLVIAVRAEGEQAAAEALALARAEAVIEAMAAAGAERERFLAESAPPEAERALRFDLAAPPADAEPESETDPEPTQG